MFFLQFANILMVIAIIAIPLIGCFFIVKIMRQRQYENENIVSKLAVLEKKVSDIEEYINESYK